MDDASARTSDQLLSDSATCDWIAREVGARPISAECVQSLWSGYGEIIRVGLDGPGARSVIVKWIEPPARPSHPRGWSGRASHERKLRSYEVERCFYSEWARRTTASHRVACCHAAEATPRGWRFLLEDLDAAGFGRRYAEPGDPQIMLCLRWLASFHARFLGSRPTGLWQVGTYWHLATRKDELAAIDDAELGAAAVALDQRLSSCRFATLVHGDAKIANFCFADGGVAAVDFQYAGGGCGIKDVAYFLSSCLSDEECEAQAPRLLEFYFSRLRDHLDATVDADALVAEWRSLYPAAWADFHRFLAGWAPGHWKIHDYTRCMTRLALASL